MFKNAIPYRITEDLDLTNINELLAALPARKCTGTELSAVGFDNPAGSRGVDGELAMPIPGVSAYFMRLKVNERLLPASVVNEQVAEKLQQIEDDENRLVGRKERSQIKEEVVASMLPKSFLHSSYIDAFIYLGEKLLIVDASSFNKSELFLTALRKALGSLPVVPINTHFNTARVMTELASGSFAFPDRMIATGKFSLEDIDGEKTAKLKSFSLGSGELHEHLRHGMLVTEMSICWRENTEFTFCDEFRLKGIVSDTFQEEDFDNAYDELRANNFATAKELVAITNDMIALCGGEKEPEAEQEAA